MASIFRREVIGLGIRPSVTFIGGTTVGNQAAPCSSQWVAKYLHYP